MQSWEGLQTIAGKKVPEGLLPVSRIRKIVGCSEQTILAWAMFNNIDAYWVAGTFFASLEATQRFAKEQKELLSKPIVKKPSQNSVVTPKA